MRAVTAQCFGSASAPSSSMWASSRAKISATVSALKTALIASMFASAGSGLSATILLAHLEECNPDASDIVAAYSLPSSASATAASVLPSPSPAMALS